MPSSKVEIWNQALVRLAKKEMGSETEAGVHQSILRAVYPQILDISLEMYDWPFARRVRALTKLGDEEIQESWIYAYDWPAADCISVRQLPNPLGRMKAAIPYQVAAQAEGTASKILTNLDEATCRYTFRNEAVSTYPAAFVEILSWACQTEVARVITKGNTATQIAVQGYRRAVIRAESFMANQDEAEPDSESEFIAARR